MSKADDKDLPAGEAFPQRKPTNQRTDGRRRMKHLFAFLDRHPEFFFFVGAAGFILTGILSEATIEIVKALAHRGCP